MKPHRLSDLFTLFFDPRVPVLFVLGSIGLAVVGNGIYDLLLLWLGATPTRIGAIVVAALLIFTAMTFSFWALLRRRAGKMLTLVQPEQEAEPHAGLILAVGPNPQAAEREIISWHLSNNTLRHCWMIVDHEVQASQKFRDLVYWLMEQNVQPHTLLVEDASQAHLSYEAVKKGLHEARHLLPDRAVIVDITGGLKPMTAGAVLACADEATPMEYLVAQRNTLGDPNRKVSVPMKVDLQRP